MAGNDADDFRIKPGRSRTKRTRVRSHDLPFLQQVKAAVRKAGGNPNRIGRGSGSTGSRKGEGGGRFNAHGRGAKVVASFPKDGGGWSRDGNGARFRSRRVVVKVRVVKLNPRRGSRGLKMRGTVSKVADAHLRYLERDGVMRDGEKGRACSAIENEADGRTFIERGREDCHQFRFIVAPEDSVEMSDLRGFTRDFMRQMETDLATETEPGRWAISDRAEPTLREMAERGDIIKTMHRALADHGIADERGPSQYVTHGKQIAHPVVGRVLAKGLAGDEMGDRLHLVIDGVDGRTHYVETADASKLDEIRRDQIVSLDPVPTRAEPRPADLNIHTVAEANGGIYRPGQHLEATRDIIERRHGDPDAFIRSHVRRLEALRHAGHVERIDADHWKIPADIAGRGAAHDAPGRPQDFAIRTLSTLDLERQIGSSGATWLDRELVADKRTPLAEADFGQEVKDALHRRAERLVEMGHATDRGQTITIPRKTIGALERQEVDYVGQQMAAERGLPYAPSGPGEYVTGRLAGVATLTSGRFAMIEDGLGFQLVPRQPVLEKRIGQHLSGVRRDDGGIESGFGRQRGLGL